jgi:hypothetical protein
MGAHADPTPTVLHHFRQGVRRADRLLVRVRCRLSQLARRRPSRASVVQALTAVGGCLVIIVTIAGLDELAGLIVS